MNRKIVVFDEMTRCFIRTIQSYPLTKEFRCETTKDAYGFKSVKEAQAWADGSGFAALVVMLVLA